MCETHLPAEIRDIGQGIDLIMGRVSIFDLQVKVFFVIILAFKSIGRFPLSANLDLGIER